MTEKIQWLPIQKLEAHPNNPRLIVKDDVYKAILDSIKANGFQVCYALLVRPCKDKYQVISGHTRLKASNEANLTKVPCWVKEMSDDEAFFELVKANNQGELYPLEIGLHALQYVEIASGGRGKKGGLSEYARQVGRSQDSVSQLEKGALVYSKLPTRVGGLYDKHRHLYHISKAPETYWQTLTELLIDKEWTVKQTEEICRAVRDIEIPEHFRQWLKPDKAIKKTISEAVNGDVRTPKDIKLWVDTADELYQGLDSQCKVTLIIDDKEVIEYWNLKDKFLEKLLQTNKGDKKPSKDKIKKMALELRNKCDNLEQKHRQWIESRASDKAKKELIESQKREKLERELQYAPQGFQGCLTKVLPSLEVLFDAIITDPPYLISNDGTTVRSGKEVSVNKNFADNLDSTIHPKEYLPLFYNQLKEGGYLIFTCTHHLRDVIRILADKIGFEFVQDLIWWKRNSPPLLTADRFKPEFEYICVFKKPGANSYFGYEEIQDNDKQKGNVIDIPQCSGKERLGWHDTQKPIALMGLLIKAYCPIDGLVLEPFAGSATTVIACKQLQRICYWIEEKPDFFEKSQSRIDNSKFAWEA